jgi:hypothetical protein
MHFYNKFISYFKSVDLFFLIFISLFTIDKVVAKPVFIIFGLVVMWKYLSAREFKHAPLFYPFIALWGIVNFLFINTDFTSAHFISFSIGVAYWLMSFIAFIIIKKRIELNSVETTRRTIDAYFIINAIWSFGNLIYVMLISHSMNPFMLTDEAFGNSTGDYIKGILMGPSYINMFVNAFFAIYYLFNGKYKMVLVATIIAGLTSSNFANLIFITVLIASFIFLKQKKARLLILAQLAFFIIFYLIISNSNLHYVSHALKGNKEDVSETKALNSIKLPFANQYPNAWYNRFGKAISFIQTYDYLKSSPQHFIFGAGIGEFSSQLALRTSDIKVIKKSGVFERIPTYVAPSFFENHYQIFNIIYQMPPGYHSIRHFPNSFVNQLLGEYGFVGLLLFLVFYLFYFLRHLKRLSYTIPILVMLCCFMVFDYLFEYLSVVVFFEMFFLIDLKQRAANIQAQ